MVVGKEIHLKKRPSGFVAVDDFEVEVPKVSKEGEFLVRNIWMSIDPFLRIYMVKGSRISPPVVLNKVLNGGACCCLSPEIVLSNSLSLTSNSLIES
jgi:NADPH-dependent curcumin reductase CurA